MTIMVIEDEELLLKAIVRKLELNEIKVVACSGGKQAVDYLTGSTELPDAIWLDYYLKDMNGLEFVYLLKANERWAFIPVLVVSNSASPDRVNRMLALGVRDYILKAEYRLEDIIKVITNMIAERGKQEGI